MGGRFARPIAGAHGTARCVRRCPAVSVGMIDFRQNPFRSLSVLELLRGAKLYEFDEFYRIKNALIRYDHRNGYVNYGLWDDGDRTVNPSAALVSHVAAKLQLGSTDVLLNVGSGLGQPDIDIAQAFNVKRIIGINRNAAQVNCANRMFAHQGLDGVIQHRVCDALAMEDQLSGLGISAAIIIEALAEMPSPERVLAQIYSLLPVGGRISLCDMVTTPTDKKALPTAALSRANEKHHYALRGSLGAFRILPRASHQGRIPQRSVGAHW